VHLQEAPSARQGKPNLKTKTIALSAVLAVAVATSGLVWIFSEHNQTEARNTAVTFVRLLKNSELYKAFELMHKRNPTGRDFQTFLQRFQSAVGSPERLTGTESNYTFPIQTNGNRLRRWFYGDDIEMEEIGVEFDGVHCLFNLRLRRDSEQKWKVDRFQCHAG
jgi:hypothetical protein